MIRSIRWCRLIVDRRNGLEGWWGGQVRRWYWRPLPALTVGVANKAPDFVADCRSGRVRKLARLWR